MVTAKAPSSTANLGPGFDVFGLAIDAFYDKVTLTETGKEITIVTDDDIPVDPDRNTAGLVVKNMAETFGVGDGGVEIRISKGVPAGFGMGSSAASAAAAAVAFDRMFGLNLGKNALVEFAGAGEKASAGSIHYDNVAASVLGGFVIVRTNPLDVIRITPPSSLRMCVAVPRLKVPEKKTEVSRGVLPKKVSLSDSTLNLSNAAGMVAGFMRRDPQLIGRSARDVIVEPARQHMIPGFAEVKQNALKAGAFGVTISGAGPSAIAFADDSADLEEIRVAMSEGFGMAGTASQTVICKPARGATCKR